MVCGFKISLLVAGVLNFLNAQTASPPAPLPRAMRSAIDRLTKKTVVEQGSFRLQKPQSTVFVTPTNPEFRNNSLAEICSVQLIEIRIDNPERFTMLTVELPANQDRMPIAQMPAPPCGSTAVSSPAQPGR
jgi:hypothetical protein